MSDSASNSASKSVSKSVNGLSSGFTALFFTQVLHEFVHLIASVSTGVQVRGFNLFAVDTVITYDALFRTREIIVQASASLMNVVIGLVAAILFYHVKKLPPLFRQFLLQLAGFSLLMGFGYFLFDGLFYSVGSYGDWNSVMNMLENPLPLRVFLIAVGSTGVVGSFFWMARAVMIFVSDSGSNMQRKEAAFPVLLMPYLASSPLYILLSLWHPVGFPEGLVVVFFQFVFGFSGFLWAFFLSVHWLEPKKHPKAFQELPVTIHILWLGLALLLLLFQIAVLLPTIPIK